MEGLVRTHRIAVAAALAFAIAVPNAHAQLNKEQEKCLQTVAKSGAKYVKAHMKERSKCADKNLKTTGGCDLIKRGEKLAKAETKLRSGIDKKCGVATFTSDSLLIIGYPGKCADGTGGQFTALDLETCIFETHRDIAEALIALEYGSNAGDGVSDFATQAGDPAQGKLLVSCQKEIAKNSQKITTTVLKEISKCRNSLLAGKTSGFAPVDCGDNPIEPKPKEKIDKTETKARDKILGKCTDAELAQLDACDTGSGPILTATPAVDCLIQEHHDAADNPDQGDGVDLIDIEYAQAALCGDNITNDALASVGRVGNFVLGDPPEECDGTDDTACPGQCGAPGTSFECQCLTTPRLRVFEHDNGDLDNGWTGISHDQTAVITGSGYTVALRDCDGPGGPDTVCTVGPSCALAPNGPCVSDANCVGGGNFCRKLDTAQGPHCNGTIQTPCVNHAGCPSDSFCRKTLTSTPRGATAGGTAVCNVDIFSEDVVGTHDLATGAGALRLRRDSLTFFGGGTLDQPCPVCGGFCNAPPSSGVGMRRRCAADADCFGVPDVGQPGTCVTANICSWGANVDQPCRPDPPHGGASIFFGTTSVDCQPISGNDISGGGLDILTNPAVTGTTTLLPSFTCTAPGFGGNACRAGTNTGQLCAADSECIGGGAGSCTGQCFCPTGPPSTPQAPNACHSACVGGANDSLICTGDPQCPGGFCHFGDCRASTNPDVCVGGTNNAAACGAESDCPGGQCGDFTSTQEGFCASGPIDQLCSVSNYRQCFNDLQCRPSSVGGSCEACGETETCVASVRQCFVNSGITRQGTPGPVNRSTAGIFCIPGTGNNAIDGVGGFTGPGTSVQPMTLSITGF